MQETPGALDYVEDFTIVVAPPDAGEVVVGVRGELDAYTADRLDQQLEQLDNDGHRAIVVDLGQTAFIDSTGLRVLVRAVKRARSANREFVVAAPSASIRRVLDIAGLSRFINIRDA